MGVKLVVYKLSKITNNTNPKFIYVFFVIKKTKTCCINIKIPKSLNKLELVKNKKVPEMNKKGQVSNFKNTPLNKL